MLLNKLYSVLAYLSDTVVSMNSAMSNDIGKFTIVGFFSIKNLFSVNLGEEFSYYKVIMSSDKFTSRTMKNFSQSLKCLFVVSGRNSPQYLKETYLR